MENRNWSIRAAQGGKPEDLTQWIEEEPEPIRRAQRVAILYGGNAVCSRRGGPTQTAEEIPGNDETGGEDPTREHCRNRDPGHPQKTRSHRGRKHCEWRSE